MTKFTPGPWSSEFDDSAIQKGEMTLARVYWSEGRTEEENRANARLISTAPELYAACKAAHAYMTRLAVDGKCGGNWLEVQRGLWDSLAKAEGRD